METDYKSYHERFMQNHNGTSAADTFMTILPNFLTTCILKQIVLFLGVSSILYKLLLEYVIIVIPLIIGTTVLIEFRFIWLYVSLAIFCLIHYNQFNLKAAWNAKIDRRRKWQCISCMRSMTLLITAFSILAVDFNIFPRFLAKTEKHGYSLMDTGVGIFVFCNALVPSKVSRHSLFKTIELNAKQCIILMLLGIGRAIVTKEIDYQQHTTEYGVHWNFFITLSITKFIAVTIMCIFKERNSLACGIILICLHEITLQMGLSAWVFSNIGRYNFMTANREGIVSCTGYIALYLISSHIGRAVREKYKDDKEGDVILSLLYIVLVSWFAVHLSPYLRVSRCLANAGYCCFVIAIGTTHLTLFYLYEINEISTVKQESKAKKSSPVYSLPVIYSAINENGLLFFLLSNLVTGLINLSFQTLLIDSFKSLLILGMYMISIITFIIGFDMKGNFIKSVFS